MLLLLVCAGSASAQVSVSWNGGNGAWLTAGNWTPGVIPSNTVNTTYSVNIINGPSAVDLTNPNFNQLFTLRVDDLTLAQGNALKIVKTTFSLGSGVSSNAGALQLAFLSTFQNLGGSTLNNSGFLGNIDFSSIMQNYGNLNNSGTLESDASLENFAGANITNTGFLLNNVGVLQNDANATIDNFGTFQNNAQAFVENYGTINLFSGAIKNFGTLDNFGSINTCQQCASGAVANGSGATFNNGGTVAFAGSFANSGTFNNSARDPATDLTTNGTLTLLNGASFSNGGLSPTGGIARGMFNNSGMLDINSGAMFTNGAGSTLDSTGSILVAGTFNNDPGASVMLNPQPLPPGGTPLSSLSVLSGGVFNNSGSLLSSGTINVDPGAVVNSFFDTEMLPAGMLNINGGGAFNNAGMLHMNSGSTLNNFGMLTSTGTINVDPGAVVNSFFDTEMLPAGMLNISGGGAFNNAGMLHMSTGSTLNNFGTLTSTGTINVDPGAVVNSFFDTEMLPASMLNINGGVFNNKGGATLNSSGGILVSGTFNNDPGASVMLNPQPLPPGGTPLSPLSIMSGGVFNNNGTITWTRPPPNGVPAVQINFGGTLMGNGTINGDVMNGGMVSPGNSPGIMTINGNFTQTSGGAYTAELGGIFAGQYDQLNISGNASLAGTLNVTLFNNFVVNLGNSFIILNANSITGVFDILHLPTIGPGMYWLLNYSPTNVTLNVAPVPEPGTLLLVATGLAGAFFRRRMRRNCSAGL